MHREFTLGITEEPGYEIGAPRVILAPKKKHFSFFYFFLVAIAKLVMQTSVKVLGKKVLLVRLKVNILLARSLASGLIEFVYSGVSSWWRNTVL